ncbi:FKBP-type peptidyl-prolyl cis-trans isomerase [Sphingobacterium thalpophilum]|uniref:FKBP-type peptidyl-prolyl cis-trans isomerase n=1 Tax=Sphingobacterium thalpophilum TaxID=259 RepID=UPI0024A6B4D8|nr:FKBP-type peptidyl-prolyl cis-trans isomerase [Sphingobacterium thalpophilum]
MKNITKFLMAFLCLGMIFSACNKDDFDWDAFYKEQAEKQRIQDSINKKRIEEQYPTIKKYVADNQLQNVQYIDSLGIAYQILATGDESSYTYSFNSNGQIVAPNVTVEYIGKYVQTGSQYKPEGTVFEKTEEGKTETKNLASRPVVWHRAFLPQKIKYGQQEIAVGGITTTGMKKGSKIRIITPSPWGYGDSDQKAESTGNTIPGKSILDYTIDVKDIKNITN